MNVYACPDTVHVPEFEEMLDDTGRYSMEKDDALSEKFYEELKAEIIRMGYTGPLTGGLVYFPQGDGKAIYMVADAPRNTCLIHCPLGDAWSLPDWQLKGLTKKQIKEMVTTPVLFGKKAQ